jgi:hypothetical protein
MHELQSEFSAQSDRLPEQSKPVPESTNQISMRSNWLNNSVLSKSMPLDLKPGLTAEDDDVSSLRTRRYLKIDASNEMDLPGPRKFVQSSKPARRLTRSQSVYDFGTLPESSTISSLFLEGQPHAADESRRACLRWRLLIDDFHLLRPPSLPAICETLMSSSAEYDASESDPCSRTMG